MCNSAFYFYHILHHLPSIVILQELQSQDKSMSVAIGSFRDVAYVRTSFQSQNLSGSSHTEKHVITVIMCENIYDETSIFETNIPASVLHNSCDSYGSQHKTVG